jgi:hypothetical protein
MLKSQKDVIILWNLMICLLIRRGGISMSSKKIRESLVVIDDLSIDLHIGMSKKSRKRVRQRSRRITITILIIILNNIFYIYDLISVFY